MVNSSLEIRLNYPYFALYGFTSTSAGKALKGIVIIRLKRLTKIKSLLLNFRGETNVHWIYSAALLNNKCRFKNILIDRTLVLLEPSSSWHILPAGEYKFPFEFALYGDSMETIHTQVVRCNYSITAVAERSLFRTKLFTKKEILVKRFYPQDDDPVTLSEIIPNTMNIKIFAPKKVYGLGDIISIRIRCVPFSNEVTMRINCSIKEVTIYHKPKSSKTTSEKKWYRGLLESDFVSVLEEKVIFIPIHPHYINSDCSTELIETKHEIVIKIEVASSHGRIDHLIKIPILILSDAYDKIYENLPTYIPSPGSGPNLKLNPPPYTSKCKTSLK
ncbi:hypothetical protein K7432_003387 [Basidiobolus ranarum]|uniref:Arrestin C-terminal-like domain-containing protein n=1 Tax=Basidiobolus ranarum TaxID=34480 RepID=A0ABR2X045_9FUNG